MEELKKAKGATHGGGLTGKVKNIDRSRIPTRSFLKNQKPSKVSSADSGKDDTHETVPPVTDDNLREEDDSAAVFSSGSGPAWETNQAHHGSCNKSGGLFNQDGMGDNIKSNNNININNNENIIINNNNNLSHPLSLEEAKKPALKEDKEDNGAQPLSFAAILRSHNEKRKANFQKLESSELVDEADVVLPKEAVNQAVNRFQNTLSGYFLGKRLAFPLVENFAKNSWGKYGFLKIMLNASGFFFFKFNSNTGMQQVLEEGPWLIRSVPIVLNVWKPNVELKKDDIKSMPVWVKLHEVPMAAYTEDGLSLLATKLGTPRLLDSYTSTMCLDSWGRSNYARALIEITADKELVMAIPEFEGEGYTREKIRVEYEWQPPRCSHCVIFGHTDSQCPKNIKAVENKKAKPVDNDGFQVMKGKGRLWQVPVQKPKPQFVYRPKNATTEKGQPGNTAAVTTGNPFGLLSELEEQSEPLIQEIVEEMKEKDGKLQKAQKDSKDDESDDEEVEDVYDESAQSFSSKSDVNKKSEGASTPVLGADV